jgi:hypothetical protein
MSTVRLDLKSGYSEVKVSVHLSYISILTDFIFGIFVLEQPNYVLEVVTNTCTGAS